jgi:D-alanine-D-alanine ligase
MSSSKICVGILFGGRSAEHKISLQSASNIIAALDKNKYQCVLIAIDRQGKWFVCDEKNYLTNVDDPKKIELLSVAKEIAFVPGRKSSQFFELESKKSFSLDVVFPVLHGPYGEDGTVQGMLKLLDLPFVGSSVAGSAVCMDKDLSKRLFEHAGLPICKHLTFHKNDSSQIKFSEVKQKLGVPVFVKPSNMGSSVGIAKVEDEKSFFCAIDNAFKFDNKIVVEECISGRELEISVLGNSELSVSVAGEIVVQKDFYSYEAKYLDDNGALLVIPAKIGDDIYEEMKTLALKAFCVLGCEGMGRCDFFLNSAGKLFINEVNSIPGFTKISMYPKLWEESGVSCSALLDRLVSLAIDRHEKERKLLLCED